MYKKKVYMNQKRLASPTKETNRKKRIKSNLKKKKCKCLINIKKNNS